MAKEPADTGKAHCLLMTLGDVDFCAHSAMQLVTVRSNKSDYIKMKGLFLTGRAW